MLRLSWGAKVSPEFRLKVIAIANDVRIPDPSFLMAAMAWESAETFSPRVKNGAGSGAIGLIQFMPDVAEALGTSTDALAAMTAEQQLDYVAKYFARFTGRFKTLSDLYMAILWPAAIGKPDGYVLWEKAKRPTTFRQNSGLDLNKDAAITKGEAASCVHFELERGMQFAL